MAHSQLAVQDSSVEQIPAWKLAGLPGKPAELGLTEFKWVPVDALIRDDAGAIITAKRNSGADALISEHLGKTIEAIGLFNPRPAGGVPIHEQPLDTVVFRCVGDGRLSYMERRAAAALAWVSMNYYPPMKRPDMMVFPTVLADLPKELQSPRWNAQLWKIFTEAKAFQVADVLESMFPDIETMVFEECGAWFVATASGQERLETMDSLQWIESVLWVLADFDVVPNKGGMKTCTNMDGEKETVRQCLNDKARRAFNVTVAQQRIEDGVKEILSRLAPAADQTDSLATAGELLNNISEYGKRASKKKPAKKATAKAG